MAEGVTGTQQWLVGTASSQYASVVELECADPVERMLHTRTAHPLARQSMIARITRANRLAVKSRGNGYLAWHPRMVPRLDISPRELHTPSSRQFSPFPDAGRAKSDGWG